VPARSRPGTARQPGHRPGHQSVAAPGLRPTQGRVAGRDGLDRGGRFPTGLRRLIQTRDRTCRTPWCGGPDPAHRPRPSPPPRAGPPARTTGRGCARPATTPKGPRLASQDPHPRPAGAADEVEITTPTGHSYTSQPPPLPHARDHRVTTGSLIEEHSPPPHPRRLTGAPLAVCSRPCGKHAELVAGRVCVVPPRQLAPPRVELAAAALGNAAATSSGSLTDSSRTSRCSRFLVAPLGARSGHSSRRGPRATGGAGTGGRRRTTSSSRSARTRTPHPGPGRQSRAGAPRWVRCRRTAARSSMTQQGLPSGSASTTQGTSR
jgi:hypothetical protein